MTRSVITAAVCLVVLAGCGGTPEPSPPPTSEDALTTVPAEPDVVEETTEAAPTTEAPEETAAPEMDQSEEGAEAFVEHYIASLNAAYVTGDPGGLEAFAADSCDSCASLAAGVTEDGLASDYLELHSAEAELLGETARVTTQLEQLSGEGAGMGTLIFRLAPEGDGWLIESITLDEK